jgi:hypothetical protein
VADYMFHLVLLLDQVGDEQKRDGILKMSLELRTEDTPAARAGKAVLRWMAADLAAGGRGETDLAEYNQLADKTEPRQLQLCNLILGLYFDQKGKQRLADQYLLKCMPFEDMHSRPHTIAGAYLLKHGVTPDAYREALQAPVNAPLGSTDARGSRSE